MQENFHASFTFNLLNKKKIQLFENFKNLDEIKIFRKNVISNILFTDPKEHFQLMIQIQGLIIQNQNEKTVIDLS